MRGWAKVLRFVATGAVLLFAGQLFFAIGGEWVPKNMIGHVSYPIYLGRNPWTLDGIGLNFSILISALAAFYLADMLEREASGAEAEEWRRRRRSFEPKTFIKPV